MSLFSKPLFVLGVIVAVIIVLPAVSVFLRQNAQQNKHPVALKPATRATLNKNAFGSLTMPNGMRDIRMAVPTIAPTPRPQNSGSSTAVISGSESGIAVPGTSITEPGIAMPPYEYTTYKYAYKGDALQLNESTMPVYRKTNDNASARSLAQAIQNTGVSVFDPAKLQNVHASFITMTEDRDRGFVASINLDNNSFSLYANTSKWPAMWNNDAGKSSTVPSDEEILVIADSFIKTYAIDLSGYGPGKVIHNSQNVYMTAPGSITKYAIPSIMPIMAPVEITVLYPLIIDGKEVIDQGGNGTGLNINVNTSLRAVTGMNSAHSQKYEQSAYDAETDASKIISIAERGGIYGGYGEGGKVVTVELGTPTLQLMFYSLYNEKEQRSQELYIPAYVFPVKNAETYQNLYQKHIVVPVIKEILENQNDAPVIKPMIY